MSERSAKVYRLGMLALAITLTGCGFVVKIKDGLYLRDIVPEGQPRGYVEFRLDPEVRNAPNFLEHSFVGVAWEKEIDARGPDYVSFTLSKGKSVRMAAPPGVQFYRIGKHRGVRIDVQEGEATPVVVRVVGQYVSRMATNTTNYSGQALYITTTSTGPVYDWEVEWQTSPPEPISNEN